MSDIRSFLRYLVPGFVFLLELGVLALVSGTIIPYTKLSIGIDTNVVAALGAIGVSGALGYMFSLIHHTLYWSIPGYAAADQRPVLSSLQKNGILSLSCHDEDCEDVILSRSGAWRVFTAIWHTSAGEPDSRLAAATSRAESLTDLMHGSGSTLVGSVLASISAVVAAFFVGAFTDRILLMLALALLLAVVHWRSYRVAGAHAQGFTDLALFNVLSGSMAKAAGPNPGATPHSYKVSKGDVAGG